MCAEITVRTRSLASFQCGDGARRRLGVYRGGGGGGGDAERKWRKDAVERHILRHLVFGVGKVVEAGMLIVVDSRSRRSIANRNHIMPGRSMSGCYHRPGRHCLHRAPKHREVFGEPRKGYQGKRRL